MKKNLCTNPWLPVTLKSGECGLFSLYETYSRMEEIKDLNLSPKERISVMRLLLCITQRAFKGPEDEAEREECQDRIIPESLAYLRQWEEAFNLCGDDGGFLQVPQLKALSDKEPQSSSKLDLTLSSGNNTTLFDNEGGMLRERTFSSTVLSILTFQNFAPCGMTGVAEWNGKRTAEKAPDSCPGGVCAAGSALNLFLLGHNLLETVWMNLTPANTIPSSMSFGIPVWEKMPCSLNDEEAICNATRTYLGRLVPISRSIRLYGEEQEYAIIARGPEYPTYNDKGSVVYYEPSTRLVRIKEGTKKGNLALVGANLSKALWRNLPAMLRSISDIDGSNRSVYDNEELPEHFDIWIGALVLDKAKILGEMESIFPKVGKSVFSQDSVDSMNCALKVAEKKRSKLVSAICSYHSCLNDPFDKKSESLAHAGDLFWGALSSHQNRFIETALGGSSDAGKAWERLCDKAALHAYNLSCPHSTDRQIEAWAKAWKKPNKTSA